jgi:hypothetical protein
MAGKTEDALKGPWLKLREEAGLTLDELLVLTPCPQPPPADRKE